ncbi:SPOSA6832_02722 [Sporobolomyces salmonicolor]|uniref:SPOSA6832_02722-mRNA-1:cds n=1 Tax=Sporidiobolus salmonicolor TaxID=5005 RepID=A0A0D6EMR5_SPOSA|nr:SPOSA6832_02722 [Sporobolomyces salmonicolor]
MQQAHYFLPVRLPSPSFTRHLHPSTDHGSTHLAEYVSILLPPPIPTPRKRSRSSSPARSVTAPPSLAHTRRCVPSDYLTPLPPFPSPASSRRSRSLSRSSSFSTFFSATATTGATFVSDSPAPTAFSTPSASSPVPASPSFSPLARAPSSAFVAASASGRVHPLTLQAIARRDSEQEALKVVKAREETERRRENKAEETEGGGGSVQPTLLRKQSWARTIAGGPRVPQGRSESPTHMSEAEFSSATATAPARSSGKALSQVREEGGAVGSAGERARQTSADTIVPRPRARPATAGAGPPPSSPLRPVEMRARTVSTASTVAPTIDGGKPKRTKSLFARFVKSSKSGSKSMGRTDTVASGVSVGEFGESRESTEGRESGGLNSPAVERSSTKVGSVEKVRYAKVKAKGKSTKDFNKLFLAQELVIPRPPRPVRRPASFQEGDGDSTYSTDASMHSHSHSTALHDESSTDQPGRKKQNAVWAVKFSDDGRYLAVGGKDGVVRVWEVLSTPEARHSAMHPPSSSAFPLSPDEASSPATPSSDSPPLTRSQTFSSASANGGSNGRKRGKDKEKTPAAIMPVFGSRPLWEFRGHEADVLDLSWSKVCLSVNNFLLSSSMDKTVRLWHVSRSECLCAFQHLDFVTSIAFHPKDDRFFLSGSLDCKLRLWNQIWTELPELITSVAFTRDGKLAIAGSFVGICVRFPLIPFRHSEHHRRQTHSLQPAQSCPQMFFEVETFRYHAQFAAKSTRGKNSKGKKITSLCPFPLPSTGGERLLVTSNDSRMRLYHTMDKMVEVKYAGHENTSSQIRASFSDDGRWVISGSEDRHVYIWDSGLTPKADGGFHLLKKSGKEGTGYESFAMSAHIVTAAIFAPTRTRALLAAAGDPVFSDGHTHLAPLQQTISGASLAEMETRASTAETSEGGGRMVPATSREFGGAEDAIVVVADGASPLFLSLMSGERETDAMGRGREGADETGIISIFRNSPVPLSAFSLAPMSSTSGFKSGGHASSAANYKRLSRASEMSVKSR